MSPLSKEGRRKRATQEAAEWLARIRGGTLSSGDQIEFADWLRESPLHVSEMLRISALESVLQDHPGWKDIAATRSFPTADVISLTPSDPALPEPRRRHAWRPPWWTLVGAVCVVLAVSVSLFVQHRGSGVISLHTQSGERRELTLADGSTVSADPESDLRIELTPALRSISLLQGSAVFNVAKDPSRPFVVGASGTQITAIGTIFRVANTANNVVVLVSEGKVAVEPIDNHKAMQRIALTAHQRIAITPAGAVTPVEVVAANAPAGSAPAAVPMIFDNAPVASIISRFNGKNSLQIRIDDPAVATLPVSGVFDESDPLSFVDLLEKTGQARARRVSPNEIVLERAAR